MNKIILLSSATQLKNHDECAADDVRNQDVCAFDKNRVAYNESRCYERLHGDTDKRLLLAANDAELEKAISLIRCLFKSYKDSLMSSKQNQFIRRKVSFYNR